VSVGVLSTGGGFVFAGEQEADPLSMKVKSNGTCPWGTFRLRAC